MSGGKSSDGSDSVNVDILVDRNLVLPVESLPEGSALAGDADRRVLRNLIKWGCPLHRVYVGMLSPPPGFFPPAPTKPFAVYEEGQKITSISKTETFGMEEEGFSRTE